jgi:hypothetical protein
MANSSRFVSYNARGSRGFDLAAASRRNLPELQMEEFSEAEALKVARFLGLVAGRANAWQMDDATRLPGRSSSKQPKSIDAPCGYGAVCLNLSVDAWLVNDNTQQHLQILIQLNSHLLAHSGPTKR